MAAVLKDHGWRARVLADDNAMVDRAAAHRAGIGWWGKNANLLLPGLGSWYVLGSVVTDAPLRGVGRRRGGSLRPVHPLPRRLPHGGDHRARGRRRPAMPVVAPAGRGALPRASSAWRWATGSTAATTARRCARRTAGRRSRDGHGRRAAVGQPARPAPPRRRRRARPRRAVVHPRARGPLRAAQRAGGARATSATATTRSSPRLLHRYLRHADPLLRGARRLGRPPPGTRGSARRARAARTTRYVLEELATAAP